MIYKVHSGHNIADLLLNTIVPQPRTKGIQFGRRQYNGVGGIDDDLPYIDFMWNVSNVARFQSVLLQFNLISLDYGDVTVKILDKRMSEVRRNGIVIFPFMGEDVDREDFFIRDLILTVHSLKVPT